METNEAGSETLAEPRYNFINTNWSKWKTKLEQLYKKYLRDNNLNILVPTDKNINNQDIENYIGGITELIKQNLKANTPKIRRQNNMECYTNKTIENLYKHKSRIVSALKQLRRTASGSNESINRLKAEIKRTNELITQNVKIQINEYWKNKMNAIKPGNKMFPNIKQLIQGKRNMNINVLEIEETEALNINNVNWNDITKADSKYVSYNTQDNLNIVGHYIQKHTIPNETLGKRAHERIIQQSIDTIKQKHNHETTYQITKCNFNNTNRANAVTESGTEKYFVTAVEIKEILRTGNSKKSYGLDGIPNIVLKHLPEEIINELCSIFNHLLNNKTFPECCKIARIYPLQQPQQTTGLSV